MTVRDVMHMARPKLTTFAIEKVQRYLETMRTSGREVTSLALHAREYDALMRAAEVYRPPGASAITGLSYGGIRLDRVA